MHYWYSRLHAQLEPEFAAKMSPPQRAFRNFAIIDGQEREYTNASDNKEAIYNWPDKVYLGEGTYSRSGPRTRSLRQIPRRALSSRS